MRKAVDMTICMLRNMVGCCFNKLVATRQAGMSHITMTTGQRVQLLWPGPNVSGSPTVTLDGLSYVVRRQAGPLAAGDLKNARYLMVVSAPAAPGAAGGTGEVDDDDDAAF